METAFGEVTTGTAPKFTETLAKNFVNKNAEEQFYKSATLEELKSLLDNAKDQQDRNRYAGLYNAKLYETYAQKMAETKMDGANHSVLDELIAVSEMENGKEKKNRKKTLLETMDKIGVGSDTYAVFTDDGNFSWSNLGKFLGNKAMQGVESFNAGIASTADFVLGKPLQSLGWKNNPISKYADYTKDMQTAWAQDAERYRQKLGDSNLYNVLGDLTSGTVAAVPQAIMAFMSAGTSLAGQGATTTASLATQAANATGNILTKAGLTVQAMAKKPSFWMSFAQTYGNDYEQAIEMGADEKTAALGATMTSLINAGIEVSGGLENLPEEAKKGGRRALQWAISSLEEGGEEVGQKFVSNSVAKILYDSNVDVWNAKEYATDFAMGTAIGGILGGAQIGAQKTLNGVSTALDKIANRTTPTKGAEVEGNPTTPTVEVKEGTPISQTANKPTETTNEAPTTTEQGETEATNVAENNNVPENAPENYNVPKNESEDNNVPKTETAQAVPATQEVKTASVNVGDTFTDTKNGDTIKVISRDESNTTVEFTDKDGNVATAVFDNKSADVMNTNPRYVKKVKPTVEATQTPSGLKVGDMFAVNNSTGSIIKVVGRDDKFTKVEVTYRNGNKEVMKFTNEYADRMKTNSTFTEVTLPYVESVHTKSDIKIGDTFAALNSAGSVIKVVAKGDKFTTVEVTYKNGKKEVMSIANEYLEQLRTNSSFNEVSPSHDNEIAKTTEAPTDDSKNTKESVTTESADTSVAEAPTQTAQNVSNLNETESPKETPSETQKVNTEQNKGNTEKAEDVPEKAKSTKSKKTAKAIDILDVITETKNQEGKYWSSEKIKQFYEDNPDLDFIERIYQGDKNALKELKEMLSSITDVDVLDDLSWYVGETFKNKGYTSKANYDTLKMEKNAPYRGAVRKFRNAIKTRINEIMTEKNHGTNLGIKNGNASLEDVRSMFAKLNSNKELTELADKAFALCEQLHLDISFVNKMLIRANGLSVGDIIQYKTSFFNDTAVTDQEKAETLLHEVLHSCTVYALDTAKDPNAKKKFSSNPEVYQRLVDTAKQLESIYNEIKDDADFEGSYGITNAYEMVAELSNSEFVEKLQKKNLWDKIVDAICTLLGIEKKSDAYSNVRACVDFIFENFDEGLYNQHAKAQRKALRESGRGDGHYSFSSIANTFFGDPNMTTKDFESKDYKKSKGYKEYVDKCVDVFTQSHKGATEESARNEIEKSIEGIVDVAIASKKAGYDIFDDNAKRNIKDSKRRLLFSSLEPNSDYFTSSDISTICDKRKNFADIYDAIVKKEEELGVPNDKRFFNNVDNYFYIHSLMAEMGLTTPCRQCYVESMRKNLAPMSKNFLKLIRETDIENKKNDQLYHQSGKSKGTLKSNNAELREAVLNQLAAYGMSPTDLTIRKLSTAEGLAELKITAPLIYEAFNSFYGQSKPKMPKSATPFRFGELTALLTDSKGRINQSLVKKINSTGGFRLQSYSDFQIQNYVDVLQTIFEAGTLGLNGHAYTKVPAFLTATEGTNLKRNISIFMYKDGAEWKIDEGDSYPATLDELYDIVAKDKSGNTGIIAVSQNEDMSAWIMANDNVGYGIPFHKSGMKMDTVRATKVKTSDGRTVLGYAGIKDHTRQQTEVWAKTTTDHKANTKVKNGIDIYSFWDFGNKDGLSKNDLIKKNLMAYIDACEKAGYLPKFREYVMSNGKVLNAVLKYSKEFGSVPQDATVDDISFKYKGYTIPYGYHKFLGDFGMFTPDGKASPISPLSLANYDFKRAVEFFNNSEELHRNEILQQFANDGERQKMRESGLSTEELSATVQERRNNVVDQVVNRSNKKFTITEDRGANEGNDLLSGDEGQPMYSLSAEGLNGDIFSPNGIENRINELRSEIEETQDELNLGLDLTPAEEKKLNNKLFKLQHDLDKLIALEEKATVKTPIPTIIGNLSNYRLSDLHSLAEQISDGNWDGYEELSRDELESALEEELTARLEDLDEGNQNNKKFGFYVRPAQTVDIHLKSDSKSKETAKEKWDEALEKYGAIQKGETPARDIDVPLKRAKDEPVSQFARTALEAGITPVEVVDDFQREIMFGKMAHEVITDKKAEEDALAKIKNLGFAGAVNNWNELFRDEKIGKKDFVFGMVLYNQAVTNKDYKLAMKLISDLTIASSQSAQVLQSVRMLKKMSPDGTLYYLEKSVEKMNEEFKEQLGEKFENIEIDSELMKELYEAETTEARDEALEKIEQNIADQIPATLMDKWNAWRYLAMLGNLRTHGRNIFGNLSFWGARKVKNLLGAVMEKAIPVEERTKSIKKTKESVDFAKEDAEVMKDILTGTGGKYATANKIQQKRTIFKTKWLEFIRKKNFDFLEAEDWWFLKDAYQDSLAQLITARKIDVNSLKAGTSEANDLLNKIRAYAINEAKVATFRQMSELGNVINRAKRNAQKGGIGKKAGGILLEGVLPFTNVPINIAKQGVAFSPIGLGIGIKETLSDVKKGKKTASEAIDTLSKGLTGTAITALGVVLSAMGLIVAEPDEDDKKKEYDKMRGHQSYALEIGDSSYTIDWLTPSSLPLFVGVELCNLFKQEGASVWDIVNGLSRIADPMVELSVLQGVSDALSTAKYTEENPFVTVPVGMLTSYLGQALPTLGGQITRLVDGKQRTVYIEKGEGFLTGQFKRFIQTTAKKIPFVSMLLQPQIDAWGNEKTYGSFAERIAESTVSPGYYSKITSTEVDEELHKIFEATGDNGVYPASNTVKSLTEKKKTYNLNAEQSREFAEERGKRALKKITNLINNKKYASMSDKEKLKWIKHAYEKANEEAKALIIKKYFTE